MVPASKQPVWDPHDADSPINFLLELEAAHAQVELCIVGHESIMADVELADTAEFSAFRFRLARANFARTQIAKQACTHLMSVMPIDQTEPLRQLRQSEIEHSQMISDHIGRWTPNAVQADWRGYCDATQKVVARVRELVSIEQGLLVPRLREGR
jgi:hypothetical protein